MAILSDPKPGEIWTVIAVPPSGERHYRADELLTAGLAGHRRAESLFKLCRSRDEVFDRLSRRSRSDPDFTKTFSGHLFFPIRIDEAYRV